jgi:REP element-mobilizing transposase RayT
MGRSRYKFVDGHLPHFVTCTVLHWIPVFTRPETVDILLSSLRFLQAEGLNVYSYVILENHLHMVVESDDLQRDIARFKQFTAKQCLALLQEKGAKTLLDQFKKQEYLEYLYISATGDENIDRLAHLADGGAYPAVRPDVVTQMKLTLPNEKFMKVFSEYIKPLYNAVSSNKCNLIMLQVNQLAAP